MSPAFVIVSDLERDEDGSPLYWSNEMGWVDLSAATRFDAAEANALGVPVGGRWEALERGHE